MTTAVSPTDRVPKHDITLSDGTDTIGIVITGEDGKPNHRAIQETPIQRTALKTSTGENKYSDFELPYMSLAQDDWSGGRGGLNFEDDKTRYYDGYRINTENEHMLIPGSKEVYQSAGVRTFTQNINNVAGEGGNPIYGQVKYLLVPQNGSKHATKFTGTFTLTEIWLWIQRVGTPTGTLTVELWTDSSGPSAKANDIGTLTTTTVTDTESELRIFKPAAGIAIAGSYWIVIYDTLASSSTTNCWHFGYGAAVASTTAATYAPSTWSVSYNNIYYRCVDGTSLDGGIYFEYKRQKYLVTRPTAGGNSTIYINGDRGAADSNSGDKTLLNDATKSATWAADEWIGCVVLITKGPGSEENQPWREITDNTTTTLSVSPTWEVAHTTSTEYVILKSKKWTSYQAVAKPVSDVAVAGDIVYLACTEANVMSRFVEQNLSGVWTKELAAETVYADKLIATRDPDSASGFTLWGTQNMHAQHGTSVWKGNVPPAWGTATQGGGVYHVIRELCATDTPWDAKTYTNVTQATSNGATLVTVAAGFGTGSIASETFSAVNITDGKALGMLIKSDVTLNAATDLKIYLRSTQASGLFWHAPSTLSLDTTDMANAHDGDANTNYELTWTTANYVYVRYTTPFDGVKWNVGTTVNDVASVMTAEYYYDGAWTAINITDGTRDTATSTKTLAKDGEVTWSLPANWQESTYNSLTGYWMRFDVSVNLTAAINVQEVVVASFATSHAYDFPIITANEWTWVRIPVTIYEDSIDVDALTLYLNADLGAQNIYISGGVQLLSEELPYVRMPGNLHINGMEKYGEERENPWIFTEGVPYEIQTDNSDTVMPLPIGEMNAFQSENNGRAHCVNGVYLYFSMGEEKIERYFNRNLDDIGPDREEGLPSNRRGKVSALVSYPGRVFAAIDGTRLASDGVTIEGYSSVLVLKGSAWHEIYRAPLGKPITALTVQSIPGNSTARLWILMDSDMLFVSYNLNPLQDADYQYTHYCSLITGYITGNMLNVVKAWKSLTVFQDNPNSLYVYVDYRKDSDTAWTAMSESFQTAPSEENNFSSATPMNLTGKRLQLRLRLVGATFYLTHYQKILATLIEAYGVVPPKYGWGFATLIHDDYMANLQGADMPCLDYSTAAETAYAKLKAWAAAATPLTMNSRFSLYDSKTVIIEPPAARPLEIDSAGQPQIERHITHITLHEL